MALLTDIFRKLSNLLSKEPTPKVGSSEPTKLATQAAPSITNKSCYSTGAYNVSVGWYSTDFENFPNDTETLESPPTFFPNAADLHIKLEQCVEMGIISSCNHRSLGGRLYHLDIELPKTKNFASGLNTFNLFIKAMEDQYKLVLIQQEKYTKKTCEGDFYRVVFEYDPNRMFLQAKQKTRKTKL
jgi:hypothetical protein